MCTIFGVFFAICVMTMTIQCRKYEENDPLFLTPYIEDGSIKEARQAAEVKGEMFLNTTSYSGFFTVNKTHNKNLFAWFFPSENSDRDPVMLWLQGGPGLTSSFGLFAEIGPFKLENDALSRRNYSWTKNHSILFVDNPVGTGYSFTNDDCLAHDEHQIGDELYELLVQFFQLFPELRKNRFFVAGESYAGKYVPTISHKIFRQNSKNFHHQINLQGLAIGNGWLDPVNQMNIGEYAFQHGLVDVNTKKMMDDQKIRSIKLLRQGKFVEATLVQREITKIFKNASGFQNLYNYMLPKHQETENLVKAYVQRVDVRRAIHVGNLTFNSDDPVDTALLGDIMISAANILADLLESFKVLIYSGQLDLAVPYPTTVDYLLKLKFGAAEEYKNASRNIWYRNGDIAGYYKTAGNLKEVLILNAGHLVPMDQPAVAFDLINEFTKL